MFNPRLGKLPARIDKRTIPLKAILRAEEELPPLPLAFDADEALGGINDTRMFLNDQLGCCVIAAQAHNIFRFEKYETFIQPHITDEAVKKEYLAQTGGADRGLVLLDSLKKWRKNGWMTNGLLHNIYAFASVDWREKDHPEVKHCIHLLNGIQFGMHVYQTDIDQFDRGEGWHLTGKDGLYRGGHGVYAYAYNPEGVYCMTWGKRQFMTWDFWDARLDEAYGGVDDRSSASSTLDVEKLDQYLQTITAGNEEPSTCPFARAYVGLGNLVAKTLGRRSRIPAPIIPSQKGR